MRAVGLLRACTGHGVHTCRHSCRARARSGARGPSKKRGQGLVKPSALRRFLTTRFKGCLLNPGQAIAQLWHAIPFWNDGQRATRPCWPRRRSPGTRGPLPPCHKLGTMHRKRGWRERNGTLKRLAPTSTRSTRKTPCMPQKVLIETKHAGRLRRYVHARCFQSRRAPDEGRRERLRRARGMRTRIWEAPVDGHQGFVSSGIRHRASVSHKLCP